MIHIEDVGEFLLTDTEIIIPSEKSIIKVIGVGGGGNNAVNYMYMQGIDDVSFLVCNTDNQALRSSSVPHQLQLGPKTTKGLGAGGNPVIGRAAALESLPDIETILNDGTEMVFITAGMGGGTGTGAAPIIAKTAKSKGILTVGIVTMPFLFEAKKKISQALAGIAEMSKHVDALLVIHNEKLQEMYPDFEVFNAFAKADTVLADAARGIAEIITVPGYINVDFADVKSIMKESNVAVMNTGYSQGEKRIYNAIVDALSSTLLDDINIKEAKKILLNIYHSKDGKVTVEEMNEINNFTEQMDEDVEVIWGVTLDESLGDAVKVTLVATGFNIRALPGMEEVLDGEQKEVVHLDAIKTPEIDEWQKEQSNVGAKLYNHYEKNILHKTKPRQANSVSLDDLEDDDRIGVLSRESAYRRRHGDGAVAVAQPLTDLSKRFVIDEHGDVKEKNNVLFNNPD